MSRQAEFGEMHHRDSAVNAATTFPAALPGRYDSGEWKSGGSAFAPPPAKFFADLRPCPTADEIPGELPAPLHHWLVLDEPPGLFHY